MKELIFENLKHSDNKEFETASNLGAVFLYNENHAIVAWFNKG